MQSILDAINEWIKEILIGAINGNLSTMFGDVNEKVGTIAAEVGQTPQGWNANIFSMIQTLSENVIVPIAGLVITYVLCYELISMVTEKNNMHDVDTSMFFKWVFKAFVAVYLVTHTFDITMAVFDMAQHVVSGAAGVIGGLIPGPLQIMTAALLSLLFRVNLPIAALVTLYSNPFTIGPLYWLAYKLGSFITGGNGHTALPPLPSLAEHGVVDWLKAVLEWAEALGAPLAVGLPALALLLALAGYVLADQGWKLHVRLAWCNRRRRL